MARKKMTTSADMRKMRVVGGKRGTKRIGRVKSCVFHPSEKRCIGFMVKRPDLLWMFHRKDLFVTLDGFDLVDGRIAVKDAPDVTGPAACRRMGVDWDSCVIWDGMPLMTADGTVVGHVGNVTFSLRTGAVESVEASNGVTAKYLLGVLEIPAALVKGFKRGMGASLAVKDDSRESGQAAEFKGAIMVSDEVWTLSPEGGWAESAGEFTARAKERVREAAEKAKPKVQEAAQAAGAAVNDGAYAVGKQVAASRGMFSSFKEEYAKARRGDEADADIDEDADADGSLAKPQPCKKGVAASKAASKAEESQAPSARPAKKSTVSGMFAAFKDEYDKARYEE